jgi:hypothetical protein
MKAAGVAKPCFLTQTLENPPAGADDDIVMWGFASLCKPRILSASYVALICCA